MKNSKKKKRKENVFLIFSWKTKNHYANPFNLLHANPEETQSLLGTSGAGKDIIAL